MYSSTLIKRTVTIYRAWCSQICLSLTGLATVFKSVTPLHVTSLLDSTPLKSVVIEYEMCLEKFNTVLNLSKIGCFSYITMV